jgi:hypothetical protein
VSDRIAIVAEIKRLLVPLLRADRFSGSFPHFRRTGSEAIDLMTFQFDRNGGGFVVEIARCPLDGISNPHGGRVSPEKATAWNVHSSYRKRIKPRSGSGTDSWFRFDSAEPVTVVAEAIRQLSAAHLWDGVKVGSSLPSTPTNSN